MKTPPQWLAGRGGKDGRLLACAINSGSPRLAELAARVGFDVIWIELEHASVDLAAAEALCVAAEAGGAIPLIRTSSCRREHILQALEIGGRIVVVPLVNCAETAREVVKHGKFRPVGERGYNTRSRALDYGLDPSAMARANDETWLLPQVETREAVRNVDAILAVDGIDGIFVGPGDLSADLDRPGRFDDPELQEMVCTCIRKARARERVAGAFCPGGPLLETCLKAGANLCVVGSDIAPLIDKWKTQVARLQ